MPDIWGATADEWAALAALSLSDVRPCVCNPDLMSKPTSTRPVSERIGKAFAKRPSRVYSDGLVAGVTGHTRMVAEETDIRTWSHVPDHGAGLIGRAIHAVDIDIDDEARADEVDGFICEAMPFDPPARTRPDCGRRVLLFRLDPQPDHAYSKTVHHTPDGDVEWLFGGQFFVMAGTHESGARYAWPGGMPQSLEEIPAITPEDLDDLMRRIGDEFSTSVDVQDTTDIFEDRGRDQVDREDTTYTAVVNSDFFREELQDGTLAVVCPWHESHESTDGARFDEDPTKTVFFPAGLGGRSKPGFRCMHSSHPQKNVVEFLDAVGYSILDEFDSPEPPSDPKATPGSPPDPIVELPGVPDRNTKTGVIKCTERSLRIILAYRDYIGVELRYDTFRHSLKVKYDGSAWESFADTDYTEIAVRLNNFGMTSVTDSKLKGAVMWAAHKNSADELAEWVRSLEWDGEDRLTQFAHNVLKTEDTEYNKQVVMYLFTALAGRALVPGIKADMVPLLFGSQGIRKSTLVQALAPLEESFGVHNFGTKDADAARMLKGKSVVELEELKGLSTKDDDSIKAWITTVVDEWVEKWQIMPTKAKRRFLAIATTNRRRVLSDSTGNRRWLPMEVCAVSSTIDTEFVQAHVRQLWAQAKHLFEKNGVMWQEAERLAKGELPKFMRLSATAVALTEYLSSHAISDRQLTTPYLLRHAMHKETTSYGAQQEIARIEMAMVQLGYTDDGDGVWSLPFL